MDLDTAKKIKPEDGKEYVIAAKNGDSEAFIVLIERFKRDLYRLGSVMLHNNEDVGDAMQATVLKAFENIPRLEKVESFKSWLLKIMVNECNNILRAKKLIPLTNEFSEGFYLDNYNFDKQPVQKAINKLAYEFRIIVVLFYYQDQSVKEISETLNISEGTVKSRLARARKKLFSLLEEGENADGR